MNTLLNGLIDMPWWGYIVVAVVYCQVTIAAVTLYLHRSQAHLSLDLHPIVSHFFRFWLWMSTGMATKSWVAIHRKHHAKCETEEDPHSPRTRGIKKVFFEGAELYRAEDKVPETKEKYGHGTPDDWIERNLYSVRHYTLGIYAMMVINVILFGPLGLSIWAVQMAWIPIHAAGVINGIGHYWGYRNYETTDDATNVSPWGFWIGGEELHNNHHAYPSSAKFSLKPWEFDIGWMYIQILSFFGLAKVKKVAPEPVVDTTKGALDMDTVKAIIRSKMHVMANYANDVIKPVLKEECAKGDDSCSKLLQKAKTALILEDSRIDDEKRSQLNDALSQNERVNLVYQYRKELLEIWSRTYATQEKLLQALIEWCKQAEASGVQYLQEFAKGLQGYSLRAQPA